MNKKHIITVTNLSKQFQLGTNVYAGLNLREAFVARLRAPFKAGRSNGNAPEETIWALRDVNFEVEPGEVVGIIGRNGAGKSTLLKILSRITEPTAGRVQVYGRTGSLLEVGTGFHPELTGRENIFLNGVVLGMKRAEIGRQFDEIVAFAEIDRFLDTPVKRYSSGMYVRLAFAVAAHLNPEVLIVDEVLAVGDSLFQKKCLGKMNDVAQRGRTVLFVSHNMGAVASLCSRCLLIDGGELKEDGPTAQVINAYQSAMFPPVAEYCDLTKVNRYGTGVARFTSVKITNVASPDSLAPFVYTGDDLLVSVGISAQSSISDANVALIVYDSVGYRVIDVSTALKNSFLNLREGQQATVQFQLHDLLLKPGIYALGLWLGNKSDTIDGISYSTAFSVEANPQDAKCSDTFPGIYQCKFSFNMQTDTSLDFQPGAPASLGTSGTSTERISD